MNDFIIYEHTCMNVCKECMVFAIISGKYLQFDTILLIYLVGSWIICLCMLTGCICFSIMNDVRGTPLTWFNEWNDMNILTSIFSDNEKEYDMKTCKRDYNANIVLSG